jgi:hypothetical protein
LQSIQQASTAPGGMLVASEMKVATDGGKILGAIVVETFIGWQRMISCLSIAKRRVKVII